MTKFNSLRDEVVYRASLDGTDETCGSVQFGLHASKILDFYGVDYIMTEDGQGFVEVETFSEHIEVSGKVGEGYYSPVEVRWNEIVEAINDEWLV